MASVTLSSIWQCAHTTATGKCLTVLVFQRVERVKQLKKSTRTLLMQTHETYNTEINLSLTITYIKRIAK